MIDSLPDIFIQQNSPFLIAKFMACPGSFFRATCRVNNQPKDFYA